MKGALYSLSERVGLLPLIFKETDGGFYTAAADIPLFEGDLLTAERSGRFTSFYPKEEWYFAAAEFFINAPEAKALFTLENDRLIKPFSAFMFSKGAKGGGRNLSGAAKKMLLSASFLEADMLRAKMRGDPAVILRRSEKTAAHYFDDYYSGGIIKGEKGYVSRAAAGFFKTVLSSLGFDFENIDFNIK